MKNIKLSKRIYLLTFASVIMLNAFLAAFLLRTVLAQTSDDKFKNQSPIEVEVNLPKDSPLSITIVNVDNSDSTFQLVNYAIQNVSNKPIRAYTLLSQRKVGGKIIASSFTNKLFQPQAVNTLQYAEERANIKSNEKISFSIDYVDFADNSSWGEDTQLTSKQFADELIGRKAAIKDLKILIKNQNTGTLGNLLEQDILDLQVLIPSSYTNEKAQKAYQSGYKSVIINLQRYKQSKADILLNKLDEMEQVIGKEKKQ